MAGIEGIPEELLRSYYQNHFPAEELSKWLSQVKNPRLGDSHQFNSFPNREFSFTLKEDIYVRHKNFANPEELRSELVKITPQKIHFFIEVEHSLCRCTFRVFQFKFSS